MMTGNHFKAWRERMGFNRSQAAEALGVGRNQPQIYEEMEDTQIPAYIARACMHLEDESKELTGDDAMSALKQFETRNRKDMKMIEIIAVTVRGGAHRPFPSIIRYYVEWFATSGVKTFSQEIEDRLMIGLKGQILTEARKMERSGLGQADSWQHFDRLELLGIFTTARAKALLDYWDSPLNLREKFYSQTMGAG